MLCATFPTVPVVALTATASKRDVTEMKVSLNLKNPLEIVGNPNRPNIFYKKVFRRGDDVDFFYELLNPIAIGLKEKKVDYPISILYLPLRWCGFSFKFFQKQLGDDQYYSPVNPVERKPENRLFAQYHSPKTRTMKDSILKELSSPSSTVRVVFATVAMGMGVDIPSIRNVIHVGPPRTIREYIQETGRAGRDGKQSFALLLRSQWGWVWISHQSEMSFMLDHHAPSGSIFKKLGGQVVMGNNLLQFYTTTTETLQRIRRA